MGETGRILSADEMERLYGDFYQRSGRVRLDPDAIPRQFWPLVPYAEFWGISDDWDREELVRDAPLEVQQNLKAVVMPLDNKMGEWLAGPEANISPPSPEYVAYSAMRIAADYAAVRIRNEAENYRFLNSASMKVVYGDFYQKSPRVMLDREAIPFGCLSLAHYAEFWGISDDQARKALVDQAPPEIRKNLKDVVARFEGDLNEWRDGRDPQHPPSTPEYHAFEFMRSAAESV